MNKLVRFLAIPIAVGLAAFAFSFGKVWYKGDASGLAGETRESFISSAVDSCITKHSATIQDKVSLKIYCECNATFIADKISNNQAISLSKRNPSDVLNTMQSTIQSAASACETKVPKR